MLKNKNKYKKMLAKRNEPRSFVSTECGKIGLIEEGYRDFSQIQIKNKPKNSHFILSILIFLLSFLLANKVETIGFFRIDKRANARKIKWIIEYLAFFDEFILAKYTFAIIFDIYIIILNIIKKNEEKIILFIIMKKEVTQNYLPSYVNEYIETKNIMINNN